MLDSILQNDVHLLDQLRKGDEKALEELYERYWEQLFISAYNLVKNREICEDILQEIFIDLWNKRERLEIRVSLKSYLYTCTVYKVYDYFRKNKKIIKIELLEDFDKRIQTSDPESRMIHEELVSHVNNAIDSLPEKCRIIFRLSRDEQLSYKEIADKLNISVKTVEAQITKALKILKSTISNIASIELILFIFHDMIT